MLKISALSQTTTRLGKKETKKVNSQRSSVDNSYRVLSSTIPETLGRNIDGIKADDFVSESRSFWS